MQLFADYRSEAAEPVRAQVRTHLFGAALSIPIVTTLPDLGGMLGLLF